MFGMMGKISHNNPDIKGFRACLSIRSICLVRFNFIGIEIDPLNSDFDSEPDSDLDYPRVRTVMLFAGFCFYLKI